ncbi:MAG: MmcQ/YjbR family DNA-binding protein [Chitinophagales bacterium]
MQLEDFQNLAAQLKGTTEDIKWENHLCFCVAGKMYAILSMDVQPITISFKVADEDFEQMAAQNGFIPAPYLARNKWVYCKDANLVPPRKWKEYLANSYELVKAKLPKKIQQGL